MKKVIAILFVLILMFCTVSVYATSNTEAVLKNDSTVNLVKIKDKEMKNL